MPHKLFVALDRFSPNGSHQRELLDGIHGDLVGQIKPTIRTPFFGLEVGRSPSEADDRQRDSTRQIGPYRPQRRLLPCCSERIAEWWSALRVSGVNKSAKMKLPTTSARSYPSQFNSVLLMAIKVLPDSRSDIRTAHYCRGRAIRRPSFESAPSPAELFFRRLLPLPSCKWLRLETAPTLACAHRLVSPTFSSRVSAFLPCGF